MEAGPPPRRSGRGLSVGVLQPVVVKQARRSAVAEAPGDSPLTAPASRRGLERGRWLGVRLRAAVEWGGGPRLQGDAGCFLCGDAECPGGGAGCFL
jgi:hypothetical protein